MRMYDIIQKKRDGKELSPEEIHFFIGGYSSEKIPDYQAAALIMAIFLNGMTPIETSELTLTMAKSGQTMDLSSIEGIKVDKHSTGGVGDKTTLVVAPIVASCGAPVAKLSGRGLGHSGGTIDKLESIPGFKVYLEPQEFIRNVNEIKIAVAAQTGNIAPADKKIYALRDSTATVECIPLIASSIMSKKLASGADKIVLDVKTGSGAFMKTLDDAKALAKAMVEIGKNSGRETVAFVTDMDVPLGNNIGNSLEVIEAIETLKGRGPKDFESISIEIAAKMLSLAGQGDMEVCIRKAKDAITSGRALAKFAEMIERQSGTPKIIDDYGLLPQAAIKFEFVAPRAGFVGHIQSDLLGTASMVLGAGRETKEQDIDYGAGIVINKKTGMNIEKGEVLATLYTSDEKKLDAAQDILKSAIEILDKPLPIKPLILAYIE